MTSNPIPIDVRGRQMGGRGRALICTPLTGRSAGALLSELAGILQQKPDLIEWRVDFFDAIADPAQVLAAARQLREMAGSVPIVFTRRAMHEGGEPIDVDEDSVVELYAALCASGHVDFVDYELSQLDHHRRRVRAVSQAHGVAMIVSCHDFTQTPTSVSMLSTLTRAEREGADIAKLAVWPRDPSDVLRLLETSLQANTALRIPLITMSMGALGALSRACGWQYGSSVSFAIGQHGSAPGQIPIDALRATMAALGAEM